MTPSLLPGARPLWVTGATGFLGRHVLLSAHATGSAVHPVVRRPQGWYALDWRGEVGDPAPIGVPLTCEALLRASAHHGPPRAVVHLAARVAHTRRGGEELVAENVGLVREVARFCEAADARLVFVSTSGTVGCFRHPDQAADEDAPFALDRVGRWPYYRSKVEAEQCVLDRRARGRLDAVILRPPVLLGPGDHRRRATTHVQRVLSGRGALRLPGGMHFADIRDVADALLAAADHPAPRPIYHLPGTHCALDRFFAMVEEVSGVRAPPSGLPLPVLWGGSEVLSRVGVHGVLPDPVLVEMAHHWWGLRSRHAAADLDYRPRPGHQVLADTVRWLRRPSPLLGGAA